jgi:hypothetical protein
MDHADFTGSRPNAFENNLVHSHVPSMIRSNGGLRFDHNLYWHTGRGEPRWDYDGRQYLGFTAYQKGSGQDAAGIFADPRLTATVRPHGGSPAIDAGTTALATSDAFGTAVPQGKAPDIGAIEQAAIERPLKAAGSPGRRMPERGQWSLVSHLADDDASRAQVVFLQAAVEQFGERGLAVGVVLRGVESDRQYDWNLGAIRVLTSTDTREVRKFPSTYLVAPDGTTVRAWEGFAPPADLGLALRALIGTPSGALPIALPPDAPDTQRQR